METTKCDTENPLYIRVADGSIQEYHTLGKARSKESLSSSTNEKLTGRITDPYMKGNKFAQKTGVQHGGCKNSKRHLRSTISSQKT